MCWTFDSLQMIDVVVYPSLSRCLASSSSSSLPSPCFVVNVGQTVMIVKTATYIDHRYSTFERCTNQCTKMYIMMVMMSMILLAISTNTWWLVVPWQIFSFGQSSVVSNTANTNNTTPHTYTYTWSWPYNILPEELVIVGFSQHSCPNTARP